MNGLILCDVPDDQLIHPGVLLHHAKLDAAIEHERDF